MCYRLTALATFLLFLSASINLDAAEVPLGTNSNGLYTVRVEVNRSTSLNFLLDSGAAVVVIPRRLLQYLVQNGTVLQSDIIGFGTAETADSSVYPAMGVRLRELRIGGTIVRDVVAAIVPGINYPLLGQSFLGKFASVMFDNQRHVLVLSGSASFPESMSAAPSAPSYPSNSATSAVGAGAYGASMSPYAYPPYWAAWYGGDPR